MIKIWVSEWVRSLCLARHINRPFRRRVFPGNHLHWYWQTKNAKHTKQNKYTSWAIKTYHFSLDHNFHVSWWTSALVLAERRMDALQRSYNIKNFTVTVSLHYLINTKTHKTARFEVNCHRILLLNSQQHEWVCKLKWAVFFKFDRKFLHQSSFIKIIILSSKQSINQSIIYCQ